MALAHFKGYSSFLWLNLSAKCQHCQDRLINNVDLLAKFIEFHRQTLSFVLLLWRSVVDGHIFIPFIVILTIFSFSFFLPSSGLQQLYKPCESLLIKLSKKKEKTNVQ